MLYERKSLFCFEQVHHTFLSVHHVFLSVHSAFVQCLFCICHASILDVFIVRSLCIQCPFCTCIYVEQKQNGNFSTTVTIVPQQTIQRRGAVLPPFSYITAYLIPDGPTSQKLTLVQVGHSCKHDL